MMERGIPHFREGAARLPFTERQAIEDLREPFASCEEHDLERWTEKVAHLLCVGSHKTWSHALEGINQWCIGAWEDFDQRMNKLGLTVAERTEIKKLGDKYVELKNRRAPSSAKVLVKCGEVQLKLTMTPKFMVKTLDVAVLKPFLGAYSKKLALDTPATLDDVEKVQMVHDMIYVDDEKKKEDIADLTAPLNKIFYEENVKLHLKLKESASGQKLLEAPKAAAAAPAPEEPPKGPVDVADDAPPKPVPEPVLLSGDEAAQMWKEKFG